MRSRSIRLIRWRSERLRPIKRRQLPSLSHPRRSWARHATPRRCIYLLKTQPWGSHSHSHSQSQLSSQHSLLLLSACTAPPALHYRQYQVPFPFPPLISPSFFLLAAARLCVWMCVDDTSSQFQKVSFVFDLGRRAVGGGGVLVLCS